MESNSKARRIHPLVAGAAISVMLVSLTGVAAITGLLPNSHSTASGAGATVTDPVAAVSPAAPAAPAETRAAAEPKAKPAAPVVQKQKAPAPRTAQASRSYAAPAAVAQAPAICHSCGRVESVQVTQDAAPPSGVGMVAGALLGGVLGNQVGGGNGRKLATVAGAVGGGYAGNEVEKRTRAVTTYQVRVRMEGGEIRTFPYPQQPAWSIGDRVRIIDGQLTARA